MANRRNGRKRKRRYVLEYLESKQMLTGTVCEPCEDNSDVLAATNDSTAPPAITQSETGFEIASVDLTNSATATRQTRFGPAEVLDLTGGTQTVTGDLSNFPVAVFALDPVAVTEVAIEVGATTSTQLIVYDADRTLVATSTNGRLDVELQPGEYDLFVYNLASNPGEFALEITTPVSNPFIDEFPEVAYVGRDFDWNLNAINAPEVWAQGFTGEDTLVAVIDTGVDYTHLDLDDNIWTNPGEIAGDGIDNDRNGYVDDIHGWDFAYFDNDPSDVNGHGTHVAGTIAAERNGFGTTGVAYDATILPVKVLRDNGSGSPNAIAAGIRYAVDVGADVINLSLGGGVTQALVGALRYAQANDVLIVAASGNDAASTPGAPAIYSSFFENTLSVGSHTRSDTLSSFSNRVGSSTAVQVDAPGSRIASTAPGGEYQYLSGTSMATPHVAGVAALAYSANQALSAADVRSIIVDGANQEIRGSDSVGGVNAARTVAQAFQFDVSPALSASAATSERTTSSNLAAMFVTSTDARELEALAYAVTTNHVSAEVTELDTSADPVVVSTDLMVAPANPANPAWADIHFRTATHASESTQQHTGKANVSAHDEAITQLTTELS